MRRVAFALIVASFGAVPALAQQDHPATTVYEMLLKQQFRELRDHVPPEEMNRAIAQFYAMPKANGWVSAFKSAVQAPGSVLRKLDPALFMRLLKEAEDHDHAAASHLINPGMAEPQRP